MNDVARGSHAYTAEFYQITGEGSRRSADAIVPIVMDLVQPRSVVDVGCGAGDWLRRFQQAGVQDVYGLDGHWAAPTAHAFPFREVDLGKPFSLERSFSLVVSLEVGEHLPEAAAAGFVDALTKLGSVVLFSAAIPRQGGVEHANEQWPEYRAALFAGHHYVAVDCIRPRVWNDERVEWWYVQNTLLYVERAALDRMPQLVEDARRTDPTRLSIIHRRAYLHQASLIDDARVRPDPDRLPASTLLALAPKVLGQAILRRITGR